MVPIALVSPTTNCPDKFLSVVDTPIGVVFGEVGTNEAQINETCFKKIRQLF